VLKVASIACLLALGCGGSSNKSDEPTTAKEKQLREARASGDPDAAKGWGKWRYTGDRNECFFVVSGKCFKTEKAACTAARCKGGKKCSVVGGGPATVSCAK
jgi:hypothetical protein